MNKSIADFSMETFSLKGKVAIVSGGNTNLGMAFSIALAKAGADLYIPHFLDNVAEVRNAIEATGSQVAFIQGDLTNKEYLCEVVRSCVQEYGRIDILVNNAGANYFEKFEDFPDEKWASVIDVNLNAAYYLGHEVAKVMMKQKQGKIINISSVMAFTADYNCPPYITSKHGLIGLTRCFANELGKYDIQTNALCPGFFATDVNKGVQENKELFEKISSRLPAGKWGQIGDLMGTVVYLASNASKYVNGWSICVDGGFSCIL